MKPLEILKRLFLPRHCLVCQDAIDYDREEPFCDDCLPLWDEVVFEKCRQCGMESEYCHCTPKQLKGINQGIFSFAVHYSAQAESTCGKILFRFKHHDALPIQTFLAEQMKRAFLKKCAQCHIDYSTYTVLFVPRKESGIRKYQFDHIESLAKCFADSLSLPVENGFVNRGKGEQKKLNKAQRLENAKKSYELSEKFSPKGRNFIVVDDIITSGATERVCCELLLKNGASKVFPVVFAKDNFKKGVNKNVKRYTEYHFPGTSQNS